MKSRRGKIAKFALGLAVAGVCLGAEVSASHAQSASCGQLAASLQALNASPDFANLNQSLRTGQAVAANVRNLEGAYVRTGCQAAQDQRLRQTQQCRGLARQILGGRADYARLSQSVETGSTLARQRQGVLQQMARNGCGQPGSGARFYDDTNQARGRGRPNFFQRLFGNPADNGYDDGNQNGQTIQDPYASGQTQATIKTVCVRKSDGYYWPISYATLRDYIPRDASQCQSECPNAEVELYYYDNPGQSPKEMVSANGEPYTSLPNAFVYRTHFDTGASCKPAADDGTISIVNVDNGATRAEVNVDNGSFPLPLRDPRRAGQTTAAPLDRTQIAGVPLPRPRPVAGEAGPPPASGPTISARDRMVKVGNRIVRLVGPDTPYAPTTGAGT